jgi:ankyrin repeat protein
MHQNRPQVSGAFLIKAFEENQIEDVYEAFGHDPKAMIEYRGSLGTLLHHASRFGEYGVFVNLLELNIDPNVQNDPDGDTMLHLLARRNALAMLEYVMGIADRDEGTGRVNFSREGELPLDINAITATPTFSVDRKRLYSQKMHAVSEKLRLENHFLQLQTYI